MNVQHRTSLRAVGYYEPEANVERRIMMSLRSSNYFNVELVNEHRTLNLEPLSPEP